MGRQRFEPLKIARPRMSSRRLRALWRKKFGKWTTSDACDIMMEAARARAEVLELRRGLRRVLEGIR